MSDEEKFKRPAILDELDTYNTAPEAGSIMESIQLEEEQNLRQNQNFKTSDEPTTEPDDGSKEDAKEAARRGLPNDYLPLNSSIQDLRGQVDQRLTGIERSLTQRLDNLANTFQQRQQTPQQEAWQNQDQDTPVTLGQLGPVTQRIEAATNMATRAFVRSELSRAHLEYERYKHSNPDFKLNPQEIDHAVGQMVSNNKLGELENINWRGHFDQLHRPQLDGKLQEYEKTIADMRKELDTLKKRPSVTTPATQVSPAVGRSTGRAIESPVNQLSDDVILDMKEFKKKGDFKSFGKRVTQRLQTK